MTWERDEDRFAQEGHPEFSHPGVAGDAIATVAGAVQTLRTHAKPHNLGIRLGWA